MSSPTMEDRSLTDRLRDLEVEVSDSWVTKQREAGRLAATRKGEFAGPARFRPDALEHAQALHGAIAEYHDADVAVLSCFWQGFDPKERALRAAYVGSFVDVVRHVLRLKVKDCSTAKQALQALSRLSPAERELAARKMSNLLSHRSSLHPFPSAMRENLDELGLARTLREALDPISYIAMGVSTGFSELTDAALGTPELSNRLDDHDGHGFLSELRFESLIRTSAELKLDEAIEARETLRLLFSILGLADIRPDLGALLVPLLVILRRRLGDDQIGLALDTLGSTHDAPVTEAEEDRRNPAG